MSYFNCRQGGQHEDCNGYVGPLDTYVCPCSCHAPAVPETQANGEQGDGQ